MLCVIEVVCEEISVYGVFDVELVFDGDYIDDFNVLKVRGMVEKFKVEMVLLRYVVVGCYVLDCVIFDVLCCIDWGVGGEV